MAQAGRRTMSFDILARIADRKIEEAIEEGAFDNLPGKGQPLRLDDTPAHLRILKNAGVLPDWMQMDREIVAEREECLRLFARMAREYPRRRARAESPAPAGVDSGKIRRDFTAWLARARAAYLQALKRVNGDILKLNLLAPSVVREHVPYRIAEEMARFDAEFPSLPGETAAAETSPEERESGLRQAAKSHYRYESGRTRGR
jgi:DnaJ family protein C protein 28